MMADLQTAFLMSMAVVIAVAAVIIILFHRFRQPLILGYLLAGIVLLTFSIGLEFSFKQLRRIGIPVIFAAMIEIAVMIVVGFQVGLAIGWTKLEATLLGAVLSVASTMIIVRALRESGGL